MYVISVVATKGGVGKSTISCHLAATGAQEGMKVLLVDCDAQKSSYDWRQLRPKDDIVATVISGPTVHKDIQKFKDAFDLVVIDCGGETISPMLPAAMGAASSNGIVVIPVLPSTFDAWATENTINILRQVRAVQDVEARFLLNQVMKRRTSSKEISETVGDYISEVPVLKSQVRFLEPYKKALKVGLGASEYCDAAAKKEIKELFTEIMTILKTKGE